MASLTTGSLRDKPRRVGGMRSALRTEIRRAERSGNRQLAGQLQGELARENLTRAALGDSLIGSADSDVRASRATQFLNRQLLQQKAQVASDVGLRRQPTPPTGGVQKESGEAPASGSEGPAKPPVSGETTPPPEPPTGGSAGPPKAEPPSGEVAPSADPVEPGAGAPPAAETPAPTLSAAREGTIYGMPASRAIAESELGAQRTLGEAAYFTGYQQALDASPEDAAADFHNSQAFKDQVELVRQREGQEAADQFYRVERRRFFDDYGRKHGFDAQLALSERRRAATSQESQNTRERAAAYRQSQLNIAPTTPRVPPSAGPPAAPAAQLSAVRTQDPGPGTFPELSMLTLSRLEGTDATMKNLGRAIEDGAFDIQYPLDPIPPIEPLPPPSLPHRAGANLRGAADTAAALGRGAARLAIEGSEALRLAARRGGAAALDVSKQAVIDAVRAREALRRRVGPIIQDFQSGYRSTPAQQRASAAASTTLSSLR